MERGVKPITAKRTIGLLDVCRPSLSFLICSLISLFCAAAGTSVQVLRILHMARDGSDVPLLDVPTLHTLKYTCRRAVLLRCTFRQKMPSSPPLKFHSNSRSKVCVKYAGPMELWNDALVTTCEGQSRRRFSPLRLSANTEMLRTACFLCVIGHRELLLPS